MVFFFVSKKDAFRFLEIFFLAIRSRLHYISSKATSLELHLLGLWPPTHF